VSQLQQKIAFRINEKVFVKDPLSSELGTRIIRKAVDLIELNGFDDFTFKKLATEIESTEASIYRYFTNKHNLLAYLMMWYWSWMEYRIVLRTLNIDCPKTRLLNSIKVLTEQVEEDTDFMQVNEVKLQSIVIEESSKVYLNKKVEEDNKLGFFVSYKIVVERIADIIGEIDPKFKYPHMLVSTVIEGAHHQRFFVKNLPRLTDVIEGEDSVTDFYIKLTEKTLDF